MNSQLMYQVAKQHHADLIEAAERERLAKHARLPHAGAKRPGLLAWRRSRMSSQHAVAAAESTHAC
jgi:hypothetical protein